MREGIDWLNSKRSSSHDFIDRGSLQTCRWHCLAGGCGNNDVINPWAFATVWEPLEERLGSSPSQRFAHGAHSVANTQIDRRETL